MRSAALFALALMLPACCRSPWSSNGSTTTKEGSAGAAGASAPAPPALGPDGLPLDIPTRRTPAPTVADWEAAEALRIPSANAVRCEVNMIREWVRVNCGATRRPGGAPSGVQVRGGCSRDTYTSMRSNANLVTAIVPGQRCEVEFSWTEDKHLFVAEWARGSRPALGFQKIAEPPPPPASTSVPFRRPPVRIGR